jgi:excisionase family DNA binding protein
VTAYRVPQLADRWGCSPGHIRNLIAAGKIRAFTIGRLVRIPAAEVERVECSSSASSDCAAGSPLSGTMTPGSATADNLPRAIDLAPRRRRAAESPPAAAHGGPLAAW